MEAARKRISVSDVLGESFRIYSQQAAVLLLSAAAVFVVVGVIQGLLQTTDSFILMMLGTVVAMIGFTLYTGFVVRLVQDLRDGRRDFSVGELFRSVEGAILPLIVNGILRSIAVAIGFVLLIVPGLILLTIWAVTAPAIVVERRGAIEAFGRSRELVRGDGWAVFGVLVCVFLLLVLVGLIVGAIAGSGAVLAGIAAAIGNILIAPVWALVASVIFFNLGGGATEVASPAAAPEPEPIG